MGTSVWVHAAEAVGSLGAGVKGGCGRRGCWELSLGPLGEREAHLTAEPPLQPSSSPTWGSPYTHRSRLQSQKPGDVGRKAVRFLWSCKNCQSGLTSHQVRDSCLGAAEPKQKIKQKNQKPTTKKPQNKTRKNPTLPSSQDTLYPWTVPVAPLPCHTVSMLSAFSLQGSSWGFMWYIELPKSERIQSKGNIMSQVYSHAPVNDH